MKRVLSMRLLAGWLLPAALVAAAAEPPPNPCQRALAALEAREAELAAAARADPPPRTPTDARWQALRAEAGRACLGRAAAASAPMAHTAQPPMAVPPVGVPAAPETVQRRSPARLPVAPGHKAPVSPPVSVMSCDPLGCWTSTGARLPHAGRDPLDPRVRCTVQGQLVVCL